MTRERLRLLADDEGFVILVISAYAVSLLVVAARSVTPDMWLTIVAGRQILGHGLPSRDHLTVLGDGRRWIDQQWLAQLIFYGLFKAGGLRLLVLVNAVVGVAAVIGAALFARRRGGTVRSVGWTAAVAMIPFLLFSATPRAQSLVYPLFVSAAALVTADARRPSRRIALLIPVLVVWANLHGSVVLIAVIITGHALLQLRLRRSLPAVVAVGAWLSVLASPYALNLPAYYGSTLANSSFASYLTEWQPTRLGLVTLPFYVLAFGALYVLGRAGNKLSGTEKWLLMATLLAALLTMRNIVWFALVAIMLLPPLIDASVRPREWSRPFNRFTAVAGIAIAVAGLIFVFADGRVGRYPSSAVTAISAAAGRDGLVYADELYADWLIGVAPQFQGRIAFDARFEILPQKTMNSLIFLRLKAVDLPRFARIYQVFVLQSQQDSELVKALRRRGFRTSYDHDQLIVLSRP